MRTRSALLLLVMSLTVGSLSLAFAADPVATPTPTASSTPSRADQVASIQEKYNPLFEVQYARLMAVKKKLALDANAYRTFKAVLVDFLDVRRVIDSNLQSSTSDLVAVKDYAEEELGEFESTLYSLEKQAASIRTITCTKAKQTKKVSGLAPKCPKGYKKK